MGDVREGRRRCLMGAGLLLGQHRSLPSVEADKGEEIVVYTLMNNLLKHPQVSLFFFFLVTINVSSHKLTMRGC